MRVEQIESGEDAIGGNGHPQHGATFPEKGSRLSQWMLARRSTAGNDFSAFVLRPYARHTIVIWEMNERPRITDERSSAARYASYDDSADCEAAAERPGRCG